MNLVTKHKKDAKRLLGEYIKSGFATEEYTGILTLKTQQDMLLILQYEHGELIGEVAIPNKSYLEFLKRVIGAKPGGVRE